MVPPNRYQDSFITDLYVSADSRTAAAGTGYSELDSPISPSQDQSLKPPSMPTNSTSDRNAYGFWGGSKSASSTPNLSYNNQNNLNEFSSSSITIASTTGSLTQAQGSGEPSIASVDSSDSSFQQRRKRSESIGGIKNTAGNFSRIVKKGSSNFLKKFVKNFDDKDAPPTPVIPTDCASSTTPEVPTLSSTSLTGGRIGPLDTPPPLSPLLDQELAGHFSSIDSPWPAPSQQPSLGLNVETWFRDTDVEDAPNSPESKGFSIAGLRDSLTLIPGGLMDRRRSEETYIPDDLIGDGDDEDEEDEDEDEDMPANISNRLSRLYESGSLHMNQSQTSLYYSTKSNLSDSDAAEIASRRASMAQDPLGYSLGLSRGNSIRFSQYSIGSLHLAPLTISPTNSTPTSPGLTRNGMEIPEGKPTPRRPVSMFIPLSSTMGTGDSGNSEEVNEASLLEELVVDAEAALASLSGTGTASSSTSTLRGNRETLRSTSMRPITICVGPDDAGKLPSTSSSNLTALLAPVSIPEDQDTSAESARRIAKRCFNEDESFLKRGEIAEYLGTPNSFHRLVLTHYMDYFDFLGMRLDTAFRTLCQKLVLKGETQEVDRILEVFAERYVACNPRTLLGGADHAKDVVHAITYSVLLLNTDLHIVQQSTKMSRSAFVKNTLHVVQSQAQRSDSSSPILGGPSGLGMPRSATGDSLPDPSSGGHKGRTPSVKSWKSGQSQQSTGGLNGYHPSNSSKMGTDAKANGGYGNGKWWTQELESLLKDIYSAVKHNQILLPASPATLTSSRSKSITSLSSPPSSPMTSGFGSSIFSSNRMSRLIYPSSSSHQHQQESSSGFGLGMSGRRNSVNMRTKQLRNDAIQRLNALAQSQAGMENDHLSSSAPSSTSSNANIRHSVAGSILNELNVFDMANFKDRDQNRGPLSSRDLSSTRSGGDHSQHSSSSRLSSMTMTASQTTVSTSTSVTTPSTSQNSLVSIQSHITCLPPGQEDYQQSLMSAHPHQPQQTFAQQQKDQLHQQHIQSRYRMEGILWRKHLLERSDKKAAHRAWRQLLVVVDIDQGTLSMFRSNGKIPKPSPSSSSQQLQTLSTSAPSLLGDYDADMPLFDEIPLQHSITNILPPPGYSSSRRHVFAVQLFTGAVYLFQAPSPRECEAWARTCNYWAARTSKEPLVGGVVNMEYGWGRALESMLRHEEEKQHCLAVQESEQNSNLETSSISGGSNPVDNLRIAIDYNNHVFQSGIVDYSAKSRSASIRSGTRGSMSSGSGVAIGAGMSMPGDNAVLFEWIEPMPAMNVSSLSEEDQMLALRKYVAGLEAEMEAHQEHRIPMTRLFSSKASNHIKAFNNWERRSRYLLKDMVKYQIYVECLEQSIQFQLQTQMRLDKVLQEQQQPEYQFEQHQHQQEHHLQDQDHHLYHQQQHQQHYYQRADGDLEAELAELVVHEKPV
ncbi:hypothetical protein BGX26_009281 [Mortierella sp. AD094]|nr:hypothetical protein BGX26_009281 [Mortierella sp. AD094]